MKIESLYRLFLKCSGVTTDTRTCDKGLMFFALRGERFDGNQYAVQALEKGCLYAVVDNVSCYDPYDERMILVDDTLRTLQELARFHRRTLGIKVICITGTNGKTTTKELIAAVMSKSFNIVATRGNLNNSIGVPLTLLTFKPEHQYAIVEIGASHPGDIKELVNVAEPDYGIITNVGKAHLLGFGSFEGVKATKGELYNFIRSRKSGLIFLNADNEHLVEMSDGIRAVRYGKPSDSDVCVVGEIYACDPYLRFRWRRFDENVFHQVNTQLIGSYNVDNALAAAAIGSYFGVPADSITAAIEAYRPSNNRSQLIVTPHNRLIVDAYNANPTSMMAALDNFRMMEANDKALILGDMRELGTSSEIEHIKVLQAVKDFGFNQVYLVGDEFQKADDCVGGGFTHFADISQLADLFKRVVPEGKTILIKGSNSLHLTQLVELL